MPRLFTGIAVPGPQRAALALFQSGLDGVRWVDTTDLHITLRFIGDVSPKQADTIVEALDSRPWHAPEIAFTRLDAFGGSKPRSLYTAVAEDEGLIRLQAAQERLMQAVDLPAEGRRYTPHVTLGRLKAGIPAEAIAAWLSRQGTAPLSGLVPAYQPTRFVLYSAKESTGGGPYQAEELFTFRDPAGGD